MEKIIFDTPNKDFTLEEKITITRRYFSDMVRSFFQNADQVKSSNFPRDNHSTRGNVTQRMKGVLLKSHYYDAFFAEGDEGIEFIHGELTKHGR